LESEEAKESKEITHVRRDGRLEGQMENQSNYISMLRVIEVRLPTEEEVRKFKYEKLYK
jgi:hypothetical protein